MSKIELENCPFCKKQPDIVDGMDNGTQTPRLGFGTILCENDVCGVNPSVDYYNGRAQGADAWNQCALTPLKDIDVDLLRDSIGAEVPTLDQLEEIYNAATALLRLMED